MGAVIVSIELLKDSIDDYLKLKKQLEGKLKEPFDSETFGWEIKNRLEELTKEIGDFSLKQENVDLSRRLNKGIAKEKILLESHFVKDSNIAPFLDTLEDLAIKANTKAEVVSVDIGNDTQGLTLQMKAVGSFSAIYKFINLLENSFYEMDFVSVDMQKINSKDAKDVVWQALLKINLISFIKS